MRILTLTCAVILILAGICYPYTGIIIDASATLAPQVVRLSACDMSKPLVSSKQYSCEVNVIIDNGLICFTDSVDKAKESGFVGNDPLVIHVVSRIDSDTASDIIIPSEAAAKIVKISSNPTYLGKLKTAIVL